MTIYIDNDYKCHVTNTGNMRSVETSFFDGKCNAFIEGYRFVPSGESWTRNDGVVFHGEMKTAWKPYHELDSAQRQYEQERLVEYESALTEIETALGV